MWLEGATGACNMTGLTLNAAASIPIRATRLRGAFVLDPNACDLIYGPDEQRDIAARVDLIGSRMSAAEAQKNPKALRDVQVIFSGWGAPKLDTVFLEHLPELKLVLYGAGTVAGMVSEAFWARNIPICSAWAANAVPVSEFCLSQILFSLKSGWYFARQIHRQGQWPAERPPISGAYGSTVGLISLGMIGKRVAQLLKPFDVKVIAWSPYTTPQEAAELGIQLVPTLDELFERSDVMQRERSVRLLRVVRVNHVLVSCPGGIVGFILPAPDGLAGDRMLGTGRRPRTPPQGRSAE